MVIEKKRPIRTITISEEPVPLQKVLFQSKTVRNKMLASGSVNNKKKFMNPQLENIYDIFIQLRADRRD